MRTIPTFMKVDGIDYELSTPFQDLGDGRSIGPFYKREGVNPADWQFMPDITFTAGVSDVPSIMHCIQMSANVTSARPTN